MYRAIRSSAVDEFKIKNNIKSIIDMNENQK